MKSRTLFALTLALAPLALPAVAHADATSDIFAQFKQIELEATQGRITVAQEANICIQQANDFAGFNTCKENEKTELKSLMMKIRPQFKALKTQADTAGVALPFEGRRHGRM
jgi:hypothetical protein